MKQHLLFFVFFLAIGHTHAQQNSAITLQLGSERGIFWGALSPYVGAEYCYNLLPGVHLTAGLGYVSDRIKTYGGSSNSEFHRLRSTQPYAGLQMSFPVWNRQRFSIGSGFKLILLRLDYVEEIIVDTREPDARSVKRNEYNNNQPAWTFSAQHDYHFSERFFAGVQLQHDYLLQKEDLQPITTRYLETGTFGTISALGTIPPQSLWRFTLRLGYKF